MASEEDRLQRPVMASSGDGLRPATEKCMTEQSLQRLASCGGAAIWDERLLSGSAGSSEATGRLRRP